MYGLNVEKVYTRVEIDRSHRGRVVFISFMGGMTLDKREPQSCILFKLTFQVEKVYTGVNLDSSHRGRMVFISFMGRQPLINGNFTVVWLKNSFFRKGNF